MSARGWRLADADPRQAIDTLQPSGTDADGKPVFEKARAWPDLIDPGERVQMLQLAQQNLETEQHAAAIETLRQQRQPRRPLISRRSSGCTRSEGDESTAVS